MIAATGTYGDPRCPRCAIKLAAVPDGACLSREQWDAIKAGDYFADKGTCAEPADCPGKKLPTGYTYFGEIEKPPRPDPIAQAVADERARIAGEIRAEIERCKADIRELVPAFEYSGAIGKTEAEIAALRLALKIVEAKGE
jgi:hypothetical protein